MSDDLRTLAQAVVDGDRKRDALPRGTIERERAVDDVTAAYSAFMWAMARMDAEDILAALDAERAQGYARAMGQRRQIVGVFRSVCAHSSVMGSTERPAGDSQT